MGIPICRNCIEKNIPEDLKKFKPYEFQYWVINEMYATPSPRKSGDMGIDGFTPQFTKDGIGGFPIQVKQSENVGRNVVDNFETAIKRVEKDRGYIIAFSFGKGAYEEVARVKKDGLFIELLTVDKLLGFSEERISDKMFEFD